MKCKRMGRLRFTEEFLEDLGANRELMGAYAKAMAPFIIISCTYNKVSEQFEQVFIDPHGVQFEEVAEGAVIPEYRLIVTKTKAVDLYMPIYWCSLSPIIKTGTNSAGPM